jgi:hypothetical protein
VKQPARITQARFHETGEASGYPLRTDDAGDRGRGGEEQDHKEVVDTPGIDSPSNRGNLTQSLEEGAQLSALRFAWAVLSIFTAETTL